jgi:Cu+-exporting ATPase
MLIVCGINDIPVLDQADIGCAINFSSDLTLKTAGIVLIKDNLLDILKAILIDKKSFQGIKINFARAFTYNLILIPIALGILI